ncbi:unnamed protein product [Protopolystoma xenopodis]|uniref:Uncharacterized protein n=1 Tax=Protopolystoma xenopodis TaxID=117903 RepID=A0A448WGW3_9PLAT|nr:unnamed protein product [Protopolystoma xenopodis]
MNSLIDILVDALSSSDPLVLLIYSFPRLFTHVGSPSVSESTLTSSTKFAATKVSIFPPALSFNTPTPDVAFYTSNVSGCINNMQSHLGIATNLENIFDDGDEYAIKAPEADFTIKNLSNDQYSSLPTHFNDALLHELSRFADQASLLDIVQTSEQRAHLSEAVDLIAETNLLQEILVPAVVTCPALPLSNYTIGSNTTTAAITFPSSHSFHSNSIDHSSPAKSDLVKMGSGHQALLSGKATPGSQLIRIPHSPSTSSASTTVFSLHSSPSQFLNSMSLASSTSAPTSAFATVNTSACFRNPIPTMDLSGYVPAFSHCEELLELFWPRLLATRIARELARLEEEIEECRLVESTTSSSSQHLVNGNLELTSSMLGSYKYVYNLILGP